MTGDPPIQAAKKRKFLTVDELESELGLLENKLRTVVDKSLLKKILNGIKNVVVALKYRQAGIFNMVIKWFQLYMQFQISIDPKDEQLEHDFEKLIPSALSYIIGCLQHKTKDIKNYHYTLLQIIDDLVENIRIDIIKAFLNHDRGGGIIACIWNPISYAGDFNTQLRALKIFCLFFKYLSKERQEKELKSIKCAKFDLIKHHLERTVEETKELASFEMNARQLLNTYNAKVSKQILVYSLYCKSLTIGENEYEVFKPLNFEKFWIDFNYFPKTISFCGRFRLQPRTKFEILDVALKIQWIKINDNVMEINFEKPQDSHQVFSLIKVNEMHLLLPSEELERFNKNTMIMEFFNNGRQENGDRSKVVKTNIKDTNQQTENEVKSTPQNRTTLKIQNESYDKISSDIEKLRNLKSLEKNPNGENNDSLINQISECSHQNNNYGNCIDIESPKLKTKTLSEEEEEAQEHKSITSSEQQKVIPKNDKVLSKSHLNNSKKFFKSNASDKSSDSDTKVSRTRHEKKSYPKSFKDITTITIENHDDEVPTTSTKAAQNIAFEKLKAIESCKGEKAATSNKAERNNANEKLKALKSHNDEKQTTSIKAQQDIALEKLKAFNSKPIRNSDAHSHSYLHELDRNTDQSNEDNCLKVSEKINSVEGILPSHLRRKNISTRTLRNSKKIFTEDSSDNDTKQIRYSKPKKRPKKQVCKVKAIRKANTSPKINNANTNLPMTADSTMLELNSNLPQSKHGPSLPQLADYSVDLTSNADDHKHRFTGSQYDSILENVRSIDGKASSSLYERLDSSYAKPGQSYRNFNIKKSFRPIALFANDSIEENKENTFGNNVNSKNVSASLKRLPSNHNEGQANKKIRLRSNESQSPVVEIDLTNIDECDIKKSKTEQLNHNRFSNNSSDCEQMRMDEITKINNPSPLHTPSNNSPSSNHSTGTPKPTVSMNISDIDDSDVMEIRTPPLSRNSFITSRFFSNFDAEQSTNEHLNKEIPRARPVITKSEDKPENKVKETSNNKLIIKDILNEWEDENLSGEPLIENAIDTGSKENLNESIIYHKRYNNEDSSDMESDKENNMDMPKRRCTTKTNLCETNRRKYEINKKSVATPTVMLCHIVEVNTKKSIIIQETSKKEQFVNAKRNLLHIIEKESLERLQTIMRNSNGHVLQQINATYHDTRDMDKNITINKYDLQTNRSVERYISGKNSSTTISNLRELINTEQQDDPIVISKENNEKPVNPTENRIVTACSSAVQNLKNNSNIGIHTDEFNMDLETSKLVLPMEKADKMGNGYISTVVEISNQLSQTQNDSLLRLSLDVESPNSSQMEINECSTYFNEGISKINKLYEKEINAKMKKLNDEYPLSDAEKFSKNVLDISKLILNESNSQRTELYQLKIYIEQLAHKIETVQATFIERSDKYEKFQEHSSSILKELAATSKIIKDNLNTSHANLMNKFEAAERQALQEIWENNLEEYKNSFINEINNLSFMEDS